MKKKFEIFLKQMGGSPKRKGIFQLTRYYAKCFCKNDLYLYANRKFNYNTFNQTKAKKILYIIKY